MLQAMAHGSAEIARQDWRAAIEPFERAERIATTMKLGRQRIALMALRALALERASGEGHAPFVEALNLARTYHLGRVLIDAHPALADWARRVSEEGEMPPASGQRCRRTSCARRLPARAARARCRASFSRRRRARCSNCSRAA